MTPLQKKEGMFTVFSPKDVSRKLKIKPIKMSKKMIKGECIGNMAVDENGEPDYFEVYTTKKASHKRAIKNQLINQN